MSLGVRSEEQNSPVDCFIPSLEIGERGYPMDDFLKPNAFHFDTKLVQSILPELVRKLAHLNGDGRLTSDTLVA